ncbi:hypothetical protein [Lactobacillus sp. PSON]|uniref:hypothetical protein n=1 Tax=Lactobacillus sp. PSON TaxID=3455454 RepID=UPI004042DB90
MGLNDGINVWTETTWSVEDFNNYVDERLQEGKVIGLRLQNASAFYKGNFSIDELRKTESEVYILFDKIIFVQEWKTEGGDSETE